MEGKWCGNYKSEEEAKQSILGINNAEGVMYDETRQAMYVQRNIKKRSCNHCCNGRAISITYCECL